MFKVTSDQRPGVGLTLKLEGRLTTAWVDAFASALGRAANGDDQVTLDLDGLSFADDRGVAAIRSAIARGARRAGGSEFIAALIDEE